MTGLAGGLGQMLVAGVDQYNTRLKESEEEKRRKEALEKEEKRRDLLWKLQEAEIVGGDEQDAVYARVFAAKEFHPAEGIREKLTQVTQPPVYDEPEAEGPEPLQPVPEAPNLQPTEGPTPGVQGLGNISLEPSQPVVQAHPMMSANGGSVLSPSLGVMVGSAMPAGTPNPYGRRGQGPMPSVTPQTAGVPAATPRPTNTMPPAQPNMAPLPKSTPAPKAGKEADLRTTPQKTGDYGKVAVAILGDMQKDSLKAFDAWETKYETYRKEYANGISKIEAKYPNAATDEMEAMALRRALAVYKRRMDENPRMVAIQKGGEEILAKANEAVGAQRAIDIGMKIARRDVPALRQIFGTDNIEFATDRFGRSGMVVDGQPMGFQLTWALAQFKAGVGSNKDVLEAIKAEAKEHEDYAKMSMQEKIAAGKESTKIYLSGAGGEKPTNESKNARELAELNEQIRETTDPKKKARLVDQRDALMQQVKDTQGNLGRKDKRLELVEKQIADSDRKHALARLFDEDPKTKRARTITPEAADFSAEYQRLLTEYPDGGATAAAFRNEVIQRIPKDQRDEWLKGVNWGGGQAVKKTHTVEAANQD